MHANSYTVWYSSFHSFLYAGLSGGKGKATFEMQMINVEKFKTSQDKNIWHRDAGKSLVTTDIGSSIS